MLTIKHIKSIVIGAVADGEASEQTQELAKICVTDDLLAGERRDLAMQATDIVRTRRGTREWSVNEPVVTCKDISRSERDSGCY